MAIPAISLPLSFAIGIPICLAGFAVQEALLRRRAARGPRQGASGDRAGRLEGRPGGAGVTAGDAAGRPDAAEAGAEPVLAVTTPMAGARRKPATRPRKPAAAASPAPRATAVTPAPASAPPRATASSSRTRGAGAAVPRKAPPSPRVAPPARPAPPPKAARPSRAAKPASAASLEKRRLGLGRGLDAIVAFVDGPARRGEATACADALLLAMPRSERGPATSAFLHAAGARQPPARLQELAEDAGVELATALRAVNAELKGASS
jgi:hypothetical protein